eukprot:g59678.t1
MSHHSCRWQVRGRWLVAPVEGAYADDRPHNTATHKRSSASLYLVLLKTDRRLANIRPVICEETGEVFPSASEAARKHQVSRQVIQRACTGRGYMVAGFHWSFLDIWKASRWGT